jgi:hypothetical protein
MTTSGSTSARICPRFRALSSALTASARRGHPLEGEGADPLLEQQ